MTEPFAKFKGEEAINRLRDEYSAEKDEFLELCWRYDLPPRDLNLMMMGRKIVSPGDRLRLIRLIISLNDMEKILGPTRIENTIFAVDETHYYNSGMFVTKPR